MHYSPDFYKSQAGDSARSAELIVPLLLGLSKVESVVDVGCGTGSWLKEFQNQGIRDVLGMDGVWVKEEDLRISAENFKQVDLEKPPLLNRSFSLAVSVEVAEHLRPETAEKFVSYLCGLAPVVAFSAAIPGQGGTNHLNEQWQSYWAALFQKRGFEAHDPVRPQVWDKAEVCFWYAQNLLVYAKPGIVKNIPESLIFNIVHPRLFELSKAPENLSAGVAIRALPHSLKRGAQNLKRIVKS